MKIEVEKVPNAYNGGDVFTAKNFSSDPPAPVQIVDPLIRARIVNFIEANKPLRFQYFAVMLVVGVVSFNRFDNCRVILVGFVRSANQIVNRHIVSVGKDVIYLPGFLTNSDAVSDSGTVETNIGIKFKSFLLKKITDITLIISAVESNTYSRSININVVRN